MKQKAPGSRRPEPDVTLPEDMQRWAAARQKNPGFQIRCSPISRKYNYGVCIFKKLCAVFPRHDFRRISTKPYGST
jgi:hypothetical protein